MAVQTQKERSELSDRRMTEAAVKLLVERGVAGTTLAAIGKLAGYSRGLVTHRFGSKAGLLAHVHDTVASDWLRHVDVTVGKATGYKALLRVADALRNFIIEQPTELRAMYLLRYASIDPSADYGTNVARVNRAHVRTLRRWIEGGQKQGDVTIEMDPEVAAMVYAAMVDGLIYRWFVDAELSVDTIHTALQDHTERAFTPRASESSGVHSGGQGRGPNSPSLSPVTQSRGRRPSRRHS